MHAEVMLEKGGLGARTAAIAAQFPEATPFPHFVADDVLPPEVLEDVIAEFPAPEQGEWESFDKPTELKLALADPTQMGTATRNLLAELNSEPFINWLEQVTGIDGLIPDPHYVGGGLHQIRPGGFLKVHADFNWHKRLRLDRRLNLLLYLNKGWEESYGGHLELWDKSMTQCATKVLPVFNRMVVFATTDFSYHGHPEPLTCPPDRARRSLALYYYTNGRPAEEVSASHTTLFKARPDEDLPTAPTMREKIERWMPPALADIARRRTGKS